MTRVFLIGFLGVLFAQMPLLLSEHSIVGPFYFVPLLAVCLFLLAIAAAARGSNAPPWAIGAGLWVVVGFVVLTYPGPALGAVPELVLFLGGAISLLVAVGWIAREFRRRSLAAAGLLVAAGLGGAFLLAHAGSRRAASYMLSESDGVASMRWWAYYVTGVVGTSAFLAFSAAALAGRRVCGEEDSRITRA